MDPLIAGGLDGRVMVADGAGGDGKRARTLYGKEGGKGEDGGKLDHFVSPYMGDLGRYGADNTDRPRLLQSISNILKGIGKPPR